MTRAQLLKAATAELGRPVQAVQLQYAILLGEVEPGEKQADGWRLYNQRHVKQLVEYARKRAHRARQPVSSR